MRTLRSLVLFALLTACPAVSQVSVTFSGDTTKVWDSNFQWNCILDVHPLYPIITWSNDTVYIAECDTSADRLLCICNFTACTNLLSLQPGTYVAVVSRTMNRHVVTPYMDTTIIWSEEAGRAVFTITNSPGLSLGWTFFQSGCNEHADAVPYIDEVPTSFIALTNYPNPFNPTTLISGQWPVGSVVRLVVYDLLGREMAVLADGWYPAGRHTFTFDGSGLSSGIYLCRLEVEGSTVIHRMVLAK